MKLKTIMLWLLLESVMLGLSFFFAIIYAFVPTPFSVFTPTASFFVMAIPLHLLFAHLVMRHAERYVDLID